MKEFVESKPSASLFQYLRKIESSSRTTKGDLTMMREIYTSETGLGNKRGFGFIAMWMDTKKYLKQRIDPLYPEILKLMDERPGKKSILTARLSHTTKAEGPEAGQSIRKVAKALEMLKLVQTRDANALKPLKA